MVTAILTFILEFGLPAVTLFNQVIMGQKFLTTEKVEQIAVIRFSNPPYNDLTDEIIDEHSAVFDQLSSDPGVSGVILTSLNEKYFCNGLAPDFMLNQDIRGRINTFKNLLTMVRNLYSFPKPFLCAINGHALAGGAVISALADWRFMADGKGRIGFTEVAVGIPVPPALIAVGREYIHPPFLRKTFMESYLYKPQEALKAGLLDAIFPQNKVPDESIKFMKSIMKLALPALREVKRNMRLNVLKQLDHLISDGTGMESFLGSNFEEGLLSVKERRRPEFPVR